MVIEVLFESLKVYQVFKASVKKIYFWRSKKFQDTIYFHSYLSSHKQLITNYLDVQIRAT